MDMNKYEQAKYIRERIGQMRIKLTQLSKMKKRNDDEDFNIAKILAYESISEIISILEKDFNNL